MEASWENWVTEDFDITRAAGENHSKTNAVISVQNSLFTP